MFHWPMLHIGFRLCRQSSLVVVLVYASLVWCILLLFFDVYSSCVACLSFLGVQLCHLCIVLQY